MKRSRVQVSVAAQEKGIVQHVRFPFCFCPSGGGMRGLPLGVLFLFFGGIAGDGVRPEQGVLYFEVPCFCLLRMWPSAGELAFCASAGFCFSGRTSGGGTAVSCGITCGAVWPVAWCSRAVSVEGGGWSGRSGNMRPVLWCGRIGWPCSVSRGVVLLSVGGGKQKADRSCRSIRFSSSSRT